MMGCSQPLRTLVAVGNEQKAQQQEVSGQEARFEALLRDVRKGRLLPGLREERVLARYGAPVLREGRTFVYRDPVGFFGSPKVYLTFDDADLLSLIKVVEDDSA
jgi:hypothetical protein